MGLYVDERAAREFAFISEQVSAAQRGLNTRTLNLAGTCITCRGYGCGQRESALARFSYGDEFEPMLRRLRRDLIAVETDALTRLYEDGTIGAATRRDLQRRLDLEDTSLDH